MAAGGDIVRTGQGRTVDGRVVDADVSGAGPAQTDGEGGRARRLVDYRVAHLQHGRAGGPVVVDDRAPGEIAVDRGVDGVEKVELEQLRPFLDRVVQNRNVDRQGCLAGREGQRPRLGRIVAAVEGGGVAVVVADTDGLRARRRQPHGEFSDPVGFVYDDVVNSDGHGGQPSRMTLGVADDPPPRSSLQTLTCPAWRGLKSSSDPQGFLKSHSCR